MVRCTKTSQAWTRSMSASTREMTHPNRATRNSPGLGGISMLHGRQGQDQAIWSKLPTSWQPGQIQVSATSRFWALCNAAGEKEPPVAKARASGPEAANFRIPSQSILWNKPFSKQSRLLSRRVDWQCLLRHQTWVYIMPSSKGGMEHCSWSLLFPKATAQPSFRRSTVWLSPLLGQISEVVTRSQQWQSQDSLYPPTIFRDWDSAPAHDVARQLQNTDPRGETEQQLVEYIFTYIYIHIHIQIQIHLHYIYIYIYSIHIYHIIYIYMYVCKCVLCCWFNHPS